MVAARLGHRSARRPAASTSVAAGRVNGSHPETGKPLQVIDTPQHGFPPNDLPAQTAVTTPDWNPDDIAEISQRLREAAGLPSKATGEVKPVPDGMFSGLVAKVTPGG